MSWLDIVIIIALAITALIGLKFGLIKAVLSLVGLVVGIILAGHFYSPLSERLTFISQAAVAKVVAFAVILVGVMVIAVVLAMLLRWAASVMMLGWVNRLGGAVFGLLLGALTWGALLAAWVHFFGAGETILKSMLASLLLDYFPLVLGLLPQEFDAVRSFF
jgi:membrane protein required for colicin V production